MAEITCPKCGTLISLEQSDLDSVVQQVRDAEFKREIEERMRLVEKEKEDAVKLAIAKTQAQESERISKLETERVQLEAEARTNLEKLRFEGEKKLAESTAELERMNALKNAELERLAGEKDAEIARLKAQLETQTSTAQTETELAVTKAVAAIEKERDSLAASLDIQKAEAARSEALLKEQSALQLKAKDDVIAFKQEEIDRIKDMRAKLSTKMIGETLEQHCQIEFDRIRATAFPRAYFEKDNEAVEGTKGDFIFRECDEEGNEIISIMFEMKNESESDSVKVKNDAHFDKLDRDRTKKNCEYAVLVSLLEPESELYNQGIVDVSHRHPKMYVIRPQFFIPLISLLRNAALNSLRYKQELARMRQQEMDITTFEQDLETFKQGFFKNFGDASLRFGDAVKAIDKAIDDLQKAKDKLLVSEKHLNAANNKLEGLSVKKLTRKNPTMKAKFDALHEGKN